MPCIPDLQRFYILRGSVPSLIPRFHSNSVYDTRRDAIDSNAKYMYSSSVETRIEERNYIVKVESRDNQIIHKIHLPKTPHSLFLPPLLLSSPPPTSYLANHNVPSISNMASHYPLDSFIRLHIWRNRSRDSSNPNFLQMFIHLTHAVSFAYRSCSLHVSREYSKNSYPKQ